MKSIFLAVAAIGVSSGNPRSLDRWWSSRNPGGSVLGRMGWGKLHKRFLYSLSATHLLVGYFNPKLSLLYGTSIGEEACYRNKTVLLGQCSAT